MHRLTVATLNLRNRQNRWRERRHLIVSQLLDASPDLIGLQEIYLPLGHGRWLRNQINSRLGGSTHTPYRLVQKRRQHLLHGYFDGIGILTRLPIISQDGLALGHGGRVALRLNVALSSGQTLDFVTTHLHHVAHDRQARQEQVMALIGWLRQVGRVQRQVIAGDFNEVPGGPAIAQMKQAYRSAYAACHGHEPLATFPTALVDRPDGWAGCLDYIFLSSGLRVQQAGLCCHRAAANDDTLYPSDHVGLLAELEISRP
jgi:endonuclease/exonuclease/phosphatase family metal-dependent hydrolase